MGLAAGGIASNAALAVPESAGNTLTILFGSQTGNGRAIAKALSQQAREKGFATNLVSLADYEPSNLISIGDSHTTRSLTEVASLE